MEWFATRCPHCHTGFRVKQEQLDASGGQVRCGVCQQDFDAIAHQFDHPGAARPAARASMPPGAEPVSVLAPEPVLADAPAAEPDALRRAASDIAAVDFGPSGDSLSAADGASMQAELDALSQAISDMRAKPWTEPPMPVQFDGDTDGTAGTARTSEPGAVETDTTLSTESAPLRADITNQPEDAFMQTARRRSNSRRVWRLLLWTGIPVLTIALVAQLAYYFRNDIAARSPQAASQLRTLCAQLGCTIRLPMHLDQLSLDGTQLNAAPLPNASASNEPTAAVTEGQESAAAETPKTQRLTLVALLRNRGTTSQAWPSIDLQIKGADGKVFVRKTFLPTQYLRADDIPAGLSARSEMEIRIPFELTGTQPTGFDATLFYH